MEKRAFIAVGLSIAVFYLFSMLFGPDKQKVVPSTTQSATSVVNTPAATGQQPLAVQTSAPVAGQQLTSTAPQKDITVDTDLYTAVFSTRGASLKNLTLKNYREENTAAAKKSSLEMTPTRIFFHSQREQPGSIFPTARCSPLTPTG